MNNNRKEIEESFRKEITNVFLDHPDGLEAEQFLTNFGTYCHAIDDLIDKDLSSTPEHFGIVLLMATNIYSCNFYYKYQHILYQVIRVIHHTYFDSVKLERAPELWKKETADTIKSIGSQMTLTIIEILTTYENRRRLSPLVHEFCYNRQHDDNGQPT